MESEPEEHHAAERHARTARKLADDIACAQSDVQVLSHELNRAIERAFSALQV